MQGETTMKQLLIGVTIFAALALNAQQPPVNSPLLDHLAGKWLMEFPQGFVATGGGTNAR